MRYEVALPGGQWGSSVTIQPGQRVEWRTVVSYTGTEPVVALGQVYYQPLLYGTDNLGTGSQLDQLGAWRNGGISGQGNTTLTPGMLSTAEGESSQSLGSYGRVRFGFTSRSTLIGGSGPLVGHRHGIYSGPLFNDTFIRIAGANNPLGYPDSIPVGTLELLNRIRFGVVSDNPSTASTWFLAGTQDVVIFRQAFIASTDDLPARGDNVITLTSEAASLIRASGSGGTDDTRFMTWALAGQSGAAASIRVGVEYIPATIIIVPVPGVLTLATLGGFCAFRRRR